MSTGFPHEREATGRGAIVRNKQAIGIAATPQLLPRLTRKQVDLLLRVRDFIRLRGFSPSAEQVGGELGISKTAAEHRIDALIRKGLLARPPSSRADRYRRATLTPLGGAIAALHGRIKRGVFRFVAPSRDGDLVTFAREAS